MTEYKYSVDRQKWQKMTFFEQMGNIYSEVGRSIKAWQASDKDGFDGALNRALDLFDATTELLLLQKSVRLKEVLRAKDQFLSLFFGDHSPSQTEIKSLDNYFLSFAVAARSK